VFTGVSSDHCESGCDPAKVANCTQAAPTPPPPTPPPTPPTPAPAGNDCKTDSDCSLNGLCVSGLCDCDAAWQGKHCSEFALVPGERASGYRNIDDKTWGNTSSWGGGGFYDTTGY
jgi:hypothetical protein